MKRRRLSDKITEFEKKANCFKYRLDTEESQKLACRMIMVCRRIQSEIERYTGSPEGYESIQELVAEAKRIDASLKKITQMQ